MKEKQQGTGQVCTQEKQQGIKGESIQEKKKGTRNIMHAKIATENKARVYAN